MLKPMIPPPTTRKSHFSSGPSVGTRCSRVSARVGLQRGTNTELTLLWCGRQTPCHSAAAPPQQLTSSNTKRPHTMQALERCHLCSKQLQQAVQPARARKLLRRPHRGFAMDMTMGGGCVKTGSQLIIRSRSTATAGTTLRIGRHHDRLGHHGHHGRLGRLGHHHGASANGPSIVIHRPSPGRGNNTHTSVSRPYERGGGQRAAMCGSELQNHRFS